LWIAFIGWFLMDAAKASYAEVEITTALRGIRVSEVMSRDCSIVSPRMSLQEFVNTYLLRAGERCFAVEDQGRFVGLITPRDVGSIPLDRWDKTTVREAMRPLQELYIITPETPVQDALKLVTSKDVNQLPVITNGSLKGVVSRSQLLQLLQVRLELQLPAAYHPPLDRENESEKPSSTPVA
jgi:CBS domain-containing protein